MGQIKEHFEIEIAKMGLEQALRSGNPHARLQSQIELAQILRSREYSEEEIAFVFEAVYRRTGFDEFDEPLRIGTAAGQSNG